MVGTIGADMVIAGIDGLGRAGFCSGSTFKGDGVQAGSKLTIGLPSRSLTAVGVGRLGLRSFLRIVVAARISSPRISMLSWDGGVSTSRITGGVGELMVYAALRD